MRRAEADSKASRPMRTAALGRPLSCVRYARGEKLALLARLGLSTVWDELVNAPHRYLDLTEVTPVLEAQVGQPATLLVDVIKVSVKRPRPKMSIVEVHCTDPTGLVVASFFGQPWLAAKFHEGQRIVLSGKLSMSYGYRQLSSPYYEVLAEPGEGVQGDAARIRMLPVHHVTEGLSSQWARRIASCALEDYGDICDPWPSRVRARLRLMSLARAVRSIHFPDDPDQVEDARRRLAFDEAAFLQIALVARRMAGIPGVHPTSHVVDGPRFKALQEALPFGLTGDQSRAFDEIRHDMAGERPMSRLLLGDVGTGKTAVATLMLGLVADTGTQAAIMAPTGVLAQQYADKVGPLLDRAGISWALLTGATPSRERPDLLRRLHDCEVTVLFGTHALLTQDVAFGRLSLVVIDEQQRFGVNQRNALREKGRGADLLVMTATPIPRTLALAVYGDLDRSYLRERPVKGAGVTTEVVAKRNRADAYAAIKAALEEGRQAYVICPLVGLPAPQDGEPDVAVRDVEGGDDPSDPKAAEHEAQVLSEQVFKGYSVGLLTGHMRPDEKFDTMARFKSGEIQVLVSTTVVEVGVDVPNATVMLVEDAERFGLSQLHQLRGRVGRGRYPGHVFLCADAKSPNARRRMEVLAQVDDGFELAEEDLKLRREGDIMGVRQSGDVALRFVDLARDAELIESAHDVAASLLSGDPRLTSVDGSCVRAEVVARYGDVFREVSGG